MTRLPKWFHYYIGRDHARDFPFMFFFVWRPNWYIHPASAGQGHHYMLNGWTFLIEICCPDFILYRRRIWKWNVTHPVGVFSWNFRVKGPHRA